MPLIKQTSLHVLYCLVLCLGLLQHGLRADEPVEIPAEVTAKLEAALAAKDKATTALAQLVTAVKEYNAKFDEFKVVRKKYAEGLAAFNKLKAAAGGQSDDEAFAALGEFKSLMDKLPDFEAAKATIKTQADALTKARSQASTDLDAALVAPYKDAAAKLDEILPLNPPTTDNDGSSAVTPDASAEEESDGAAEVPTSRSTSISIVARSAPAIARSTFDLITSNGVMLGEIAERKETPKDLVDPFPYGLPETIDVAEVPRQEYEYDQDYRFDTAAHFPLPEFGSSCGAFNSDGLIIYEGMRFAMKRDGQYQVRFTMGTPPMPVTLRLQFIVHDLLGATYTVTLPPITVPEKDEPTHSSQQIVIDPVYAKTIVVSHEGFLPALRSSQAKITEITRRGTARFGFGVDVP